MHVLIASCVRQKPEILKEFLESLDRLEKPEGYRYFFILNDLERESEELLFEWCKGKPVETERMDFGNTYTVDEETHRWNTKLVDNMIQMKDRIIEKATEKYDWLLIVDSDIYLHPETLNQLLSRGKDIISEICWTRWHPNDRELPNCWFFDNYGFPSDGLAHLKREELIEVGGFGGLYLISKKALKKGVRFRRLDSLNPQWGEDRHFAVRAQSLGFGLWVDTKRPSFHIYRGSDLGRLGRWKANDFSEEAIHSESSGFNRVLIAVPHTGTLRAETCTWLIHTIANRPEYGLDLEYGMPVDSNRNTIVKKFLTLPECRKYEWLLMVDSDIVPPVGCVERLLRHKKKIVSAVCWSSMGGEKGGHWEGDPLPYPVVMKRDEGGKGWKVDREKVTSGKTLIEADAVGASCLLVHREVLEKIGKSPFRLGYDEWGMVTVVGEDFSFCQRIEKTGYRIYVDLGVQCSHFKGTDLLAINKLLGKTARGES